MWIDLSDLVNEITISHELCHDLVGNVQTFVRQFHNKAVHFDQTSQLGDQHGIIHIEEISAESLSAALPVILAATSTPLRVILTTWSAASDP